MARFKASLFLIVILFASLLLANTALEPVAAEPAADEYVFSHSWGAEGDQLSSPRGVAVAGDGTIYIANTDLNRITKISKAGASTIFNWGEPGNGEGQFASPRGVAVDKANNVYVADTENNRIQKFDSNGIPMQWGTPGDIEKQFSFPGGIAVGEDADGKEYVYVADTGNNRIQKFKINGDHVTGWDRSDCGAGQFAGPAGIAVGAGADKELYVYVADTYNSRIQKFNSDGGFQTCWGKRDKGDGEFNFPAGIAAGAGADGELYVYVADTENNRVQKFNTDGVYLDQWNGSDRDDGQFSFPAGIAVTAAGNVYVADTGNNRIQKFKPNHEFERQWGSPISDAGQFASPGAIAIDKDHNVYVADSGNDRIQKFSSYGLFERKWGSGGTGNGQFWSTAGIAVDRDSNVYVADGGQLDDFVGSTIEGNNRIQKFYSSGAYLTQWGGGGVGPGKFVGPTGVAVGPNGNVYVADSYNGRIQKFSRSGAYLSQWGSHGEGEGQFSYPDGIAVGADGNVYVADYNNNRIQKFSSSGAFQWTVGWGVQDGTPVFQTCASGCQAGIEGSGQGQFSYPVGIAVGADGNVFVADTYNNRIQKFSSSGAYVTQWGSEGSDIKQFKSPNGIAVNRDGNVFVADMGNRRIQVFTTAHPAPDPTSGLVLNGSFENSPSLTPWVYRGNLSLPDALVEFEPGQHDYGRYALRLDVLDPPKQDLDKATAHQTFYIPDTWSRPRLTFRYNMFVNDIMDWSDFFVAIQDGLGFNHQATVLRDGYEPCPADQDEPPTSQHEPLNPLVELGWRFASYDLSAFKGKNIRVVFASRNLHPESLGISTDIDDVRVLDIGAEQVYLPLLAPNHSYQTCDPVP